ncbi:hypothetical protein B0H17DRAFT_1339554 [Mycena rosella]|uniref:Enoyl reductase (ER) domain-containing protein n=1 Tax=Mycena rosella TaxID=1033263 RepID=A0AAD7FSZ2_MYCRO|nr:hypothetical protein B0H17DRAFT_1339554 [Mycena rosella]
MAPTTNGRVLFAAVPSGFPIPGETTVYDTSQTIDIDTTHLNGGFLVKTLVVSVDPYMRGRMRSPEKKMYGAPFTLDAPIDGYGVGVVQRSEHNDVAPGKYVSGILPHQEYSVLLNMQGLNFLQKHPNLPWTVYVGAAGVPGKTAYMAWREFSRAKKGEVAFITTGAGSVGSRCNSMVIQLAKRDGLKVIASAGSEEKREFMKELGADIAFNYKTTDTRDVLQREGPIDIYWDNVGGDVLDAALEHAAVYARFLNLHNTFAKSLIINGILVHRLEAKYDAEFYATIPAALAEGDIKYREDVTHGLETVGDAILRVQQGRNTGKAVVIVAEE